MLSSELRSIEQEQAQNRGYIVWKCPIHTEQEEQTYANRTGWAKGCGHWCIMTTKYDRVPRVFQSSPCPIASCRKRTRKVGLMTYFSNQLDALQYIRLKQQQEQEEEE